MDKPSPKLTAKHLHSNAKLHQRSGNAVDHALQLSPQLATRRHGDGRDDGPPRQLEPPPAAAAESEPATPPANPVPAASRMLTQPTEKTIDQLHVLVVDDVKVNVKIASKLLGKSGMKNIVSAENGQQAVDMYVAAAAANDSFDLILMDVSMPVMDGIEATKKIRQLEGERGEGQLVHIVGLTAHTDAEIRENLVAAGADNVIHKPFKPRDIAAIVRLMFGVEQE
jgi:CheY-like chemotaxis protein